MKAKDYAQCSAQAANIATLVQPEEKTPVSDTTNLAVYHLRSASRLLQQVAEWTAEQEKTKA